MTEHAGERIRAAREEYGMSQTILARRLGVSRQTMNNIERGRQEPSLAQVRRIAQLLRVNGNYLLGLTEEKTPPVRRRRGIGVLAQTIAPMPATAPTPAEEHWREHCSTVC